MGGVMAAVEVINSGYYTTIQDAGRVGYRKFGVPVNGAMDSYAQKLANWLVSKPSGAPVLEMTLEGGSYKFKDSAIVGIAGGRASMKINGINCKRYKTLKVNSGDTINIGKVTSGFRVYMAIMGEWNLEKVMGSYSTNVQAKFGGVKGRALQKGDIIEWENSQENWELREIRNEIRPYFSTNNHIRIIKGPEWDWLKNSEKEFFQNTTFSVSSESNRMGIRLSNKNKPDGLAGSINREMKSAPVLTGIIQLPQNGQPIILMNDAQSVGGYPRIAKVVDADLWRLGQLNPASQISFKMISRKKAINLSDFQKKLL
ncbi:MAG: biotin-dependent carboxyltransferase family protein [Gracilimonas sp.]|nr:biotin-dependent carboxyltransferase family protein [Gracilimonas sp.]